MAHSHHVKWTRRALLDLLDILEFISQSNPDAAEKLARRIQEKADQLSEFPFLGREISPGIRRLVQHRNFLLTYRVKLDRIEILQVKHVAQWR